MSSVPDGHLDEFKIQLLNRKEKKKKEDRKGLDLNDLMPIRNYLSRTKGVRWGRAGVVISG